MHIPLVIGSLLSVLAAIGTTAHAQEQRYFLIGTAALSGVYYPTGGAICRLVNAAQTEIRCAVEPTDGSVANIAAMQDGELDFAVVQSDVQAAALQGTGVFSGVPAYDGLRAVFSIYPEPLHVMVHAQGGLSRVGDMAGKRINIGNVGSGTRIPAQLLLNGAGLEADDLGLAAALPPFEQAGALCGGRIDAAIWVAGLPNAAAMDAMSRCEVKLMDLSGEARDRILAQNPAYVAATIPGATYPGNPVDVATWGPVATLVTDAATPDAIVSMLVSAVFDGIDAFRGLHPALGDLNVEDMVTHGLSAPLHPAARAYYEERGWK